MDQGLLCDVPQTHSHTAHSVGTFVAVIGPTQKPFPENWDIL
jgi:hypothetical protein